MRKLLLIFSLLFTGMVGSAQTVTYTVDNYIEKLSPFKPSLTLLALEGLTPQFGFTIEGAIGKRLGYNTAFRHDYVRNFFVPKDEVGNIDDERRSNYFEASVDFFLPIKLKKAARL
ncbi:MAG: hypothetical protein M0D57_09620 [Sphingobacteriales bacterium JAD_PAG50586_3]|nr:MAG: hypothetical protein M0D57_09620 [Sphingobacteriales bacterium JAD_PAG50586_3]